MIGEIADGITGRLSPKQLNFFNSPFQEFEVKDALFSMDPYKAPGIDGFNPMFFQKFWHIVGKYVTRLCLNVLNDGCFLEGLNETVILLITKTDLPT